jgi:CRP-like cAMP-binding protein
MSSTIRILKTVDMPEESFSKGKVIFREGDAGDTFFIVRRGAVGVYKNFGKSNQIELARVLAGGVLGELSAMDSRARSATAVATEETILTRVNAQSLKYQLDQCPSWFKAVVLDIVERLRLAGERLASSGIENPTTHSSGKATGTEPETESK